MITYLTIQRIAAAGLSDRILFVGLMDTVFPEGTAQKRPFRIEGGRAYGPGVSDMKGGIVCLLYALEALKEETPDIFDRIGMEE